MRTGTDLHQTLAINALESDESLNSFCVQVLQQAVHSTNRVK
ncbi:MAG: toxin-antitoxin system HicB family antitoxin [Candidatus Sericytochromatia bacterium]